MAKPKARNKFSERKRQVLDTSYEATGLYSKTQPQFKDQCDINMIVKKAKVTGTVNHVAKVVGKYGDFTQYVDSPQAYDRLAKAHQAFEQLPSAIRHEFRNDPAEMLKFVNAAQEDSEEGKILRDKGIKLGIFNPPKPPEPNPTLDALKTIAENTKPQTTKS